MLLNSVLTNFILSLYVGVRRGSRRCFIWLHYEVTHIFKFTRRIALWEIKERISYIVLVLSMSFLYVPWHCTFTMPALSRWVCVMYDILISRFLGTYTRQKRFEFPTAHKHASFLLPFPLMYIFFQSTSVNTQIFILYCKNFFTLFDTCNNVCCIHVKKA